VFGPARGVGAADGGAAVAVAKPTAATAAAAAAAFLAAASASFLSSAAFAFALTSSNQAGMGISCPCPPRNIADPSSAIGECVEATGMDVRGGEEDGAPALGVGSPGVIG